MKNKLREKKRKADKNNGKNYKLIVKIFNQSFSVLVGSLSTVLIHWNIISTNALPGDSFDARSTIVSYEHWYMFFQGKSSIRELPVFFPTENVLSSSDTLFGQGFIYSFFRFFGLNLTSSLKATVIVITLIGCIGVAKLAKQIFESTSLSFAVTALTITSYQIIAQSGHLQTWLYFSVSWVIVCLVNIQRRTNVSASYSGLLIGLPVLALSTWYTIVALIWFAGIVLIYSLVRDRNQFLSGIQNLKTSITWYFRKSTPCAILSSILFVSMLLIFLYIYGSRFDDQEFAAWSSTVFYAPRIFDIVNASFAATGWQGEMYKTVRLDIYPTFERAMGLSVSILILLIIGSVLMIFKKQNFTLMERSLSFAAIFTLIAPLTDERGQSLWYFISKFPILNSVRSPARFWTFSSVIISWVFIWIIWRNFKSFKTSINVIIIIIITP